MPKTKARQYVTFADIRERIEAGARDPDIIESLIGLAFGARSGSQRLWARRLLQERLNVTIVEDGHETEATAGRVS